MIDKETIKQWIISGKLKGKKYLIVACDKYDYKDYPIWLDTKEEVDAKIKELNNQQLSDYHHVFDLNIEDYDLSWRKYFLDKLPKDDPLRKQYGLS